MTEQTDPTSARAELDHLQEEIDDVRRRVAEEHGEGGPRFIEDGSESEDEPVDNTIAPPG